MSPTKDLLAAGVQEFDISTLKPGELKTVIWRKQPVFILKRTPQMIEEANEVKASTLSDPAEPEERTIEPELFVSLGICTHLGCIPKFMEKMPETGASGFYCPCHGGKYDDLGRRLGGPGSMVSSKNPNVNAHIKESVDRIIFRVKALLDMHPEQMRFTVLLHPTDRALAEAYKGLGAVAEAPIAFYSHKSRTIHIGLRNASDGVFAHEVAHAVINFYFTVPPPAQMQEKLRSMLTSISVKTEM